MNHLIIHATHRNESFISQAVDVLKETLLARGENVLLRDLYSINFDPVLTVTDFELARHGNTPDDIRKEQEYIAAADIVWIFYPVWWTGMPAILKGYFDRVFLSGFAYKMAGNNPLRYIADPDHTSPDWPRGYWPAQDAKTDRSGWNLSIEQYDLTSRSLSRWYGTPGSTCSPPLPTWADEACFDQRTWWWTTPRITLVSLSWRGRSWAPGSRSWTDADGHRPAVGRQFASRPSVALDGSTP